MSFVGMPHRKQFVLGRASVLDSHEFPERFLGVDLGNGLRLSHCPDLAVCADRNGRGESVVLIGTVVEARDDRAPPHTRLAEVEEGTVGLVTSSWTGHWLLIVGDHVYGDCCGLLSLYIPRAPLLQSAGELVVSNSPALLASVYRLGNAATETRILQPFAMAPWCYRPEFRTLLAGEVLCLSNGQRKPSSFPQLEVWNVGIDEVRSRVAQMLTTAVRRLQQEASSTVLCALSGGYDSRLNLAAVSRSQLPVKAYTFVKSYFYITEADRLLPPDIAASVGIEHEMIRAGRFDPVRAAAYLEHAGGAVTTFPGSGYDHYAHHYWAQAGEGQFALDGQCYELAVNYHRKKFRPDFNVVDLRAFGFGISDEDFADVEAHWKHLRAMSHPFDRRDLLFWTGNINGVYARMTQEHDLFSDLFYPACNREQMNLLLSVPVEQRADCLFQATVTAAIRPDLDRYPYNPPEPFTKRVLKRIRNEILKRLPI